MAVFFGVNSLSASNSGPSGTTPRTLLGHLQARRVGLLRPEHFSRRGIRTERQWVLPVALARHGDESIPVPLSLAATQGFSPAAVPWNAPPRPARA